MKLQSAKFTLLASAAAILMMARPAFAQPAATLPAAEMPGVNTLGDVKPHWVFVGGTKIFDGDTGKMMGQVNMWPGSGKFALDPNGKYFYVTETSFSGIDRTTREDWVTVSDVHTLKRLAMIPIPPQMIVGGRKQNFVVSNDGKYGFVFSMVPSTAVIVVDLQNRKFEQSVEIPGCATLFPNTIGGFSALCADGSLLTVNFDGRKPVLSHTAPFFSATGDPIYDNSVVDPKTGKVTFLSESGLITTATLGAKPKIDPSWSIQATANLRPGKNAPMDVNWYPGGGEPFAVHFATNRIYVLMHVGEYWSFKTPGTEVWVLDGNTHKLIARHLLPESLRDHSNDIEVSQDADPVLFINGGGGGGGRGGGVGTSVLDPQTFRIKFTLAESGGGNLYAALLP